MKKAISALIIISMLLAAFPILAEEVSREALVETPYTTSDESRFIEDAEKLNRLGLLLGTDVGFELLRIPQRVEAAVMLVRLLGGESEAFMSAYGHPFTDVPEWADPYVGYLYEYGLTKGIGDNLFDPYTETDAKTYLTFLFRSLGYTEESGDFTWESAVGDAYYRNLINGRELEMLGSETFTRGHMAAMSYNALNCLTKDSKMTPAAELVAGGTMEADKAEAENILTGICFESLYLPYLTPGEYMPYITGVDIGTALIKLRKSGITGFEIKYEYNDLVPDGQVIRQSCPAYVDSELTADCTITISRGPTPKYQAELMEIFSRKGWDDTVSLYMAAAAKYLIINTAMTKYDVFRKIEENLNEIIVLDDEDSAGMGYSAFYEANTGNMYINGYMFSKSLVIHELAHALSNNPGTDKVGFLQSGSNGRKITEAYVEYIAAAAEGRDSGPLIYHDTGEGDIVFTGGSYFSGDESNFTLAVYSPLFILAGKNNVSSMFFKDASTYGREVLDFNELYGERMWETLWEMADAFCSTSGFMTAEEKMTKTGVYTGYLDSIFDCLYKELDAAGTDIGKLRLLLVKVQEMKRSYPVGYGDYRGRFHELESLIADRAGLYDTIITGEGNWVVPSYTDETPEYIYNDLILQGSASSIGYMVVESGDDSLSQRILYKDKGASFEEAVPVEKDSILPLGGEYIIMIPAEEGPAGDYTVMRDLEHEFAAYLADYSDMGGYAVSLLLRSEGFRVRYEFSYYDYVTPGMQGRIVGQFPAPGTAVYPGLTTIRIFMVKERLK